MSRVCGKFDIDLTHAGKASLPVLQKITAAVSAVTLNSS